MSGNSDRRTVDPDRLSSEWMASIQRRLYEIERRSGIVSDGSITSDMLRADAWQTYAGEWISTGTQPAIGNGTVTTVYHRGIDRMITVRFHIAMGSTSTFGTGTYALTLPVNHTLTSGTFSQRMAYGRVNYLSPGVGEHLGFMTASTTATRLLMRCERADATRLNHEAVTPSVPFTFDADCEIFGQFSYEGAS